MGTVDTHKAKTPITEPLVHRGNRTKVDPVLKNIKIKFNPTVATLGEWEHSRKKPISDK